MISNDRQSTQHITTWCFGLPLAAQFDLTPQERRQLQQWRKRLILVGWICWTGIPCAFLCGIALFAIFNELLPEFMSMFLLVGLFVAIGALVCLARESLRRAKLLGRDLCAGHRLRFEGLLTEAIITNDKKLLRHLTPHQGKVLCLEVLSESGRIWRINEQPVQAWLTVTWQTTVDAPEVADIAAQWLERVDQVDGHNLDMGTRELSSAECDELRRHGRMLVRKTVWPAILFTLWATPATVMSISERKLPEGLEGVFFCFLIFCAAAADHRLITAWRQSRNLNRDANAGRVVIIQATPIDTDASHQGAEGCDSELHEILYHTETDWTVNGEPASWRKQLPMK